MLHASKDAQGLEDHKPEIWALRFLMYMSSVDQGLCMRVVNGGAGRERVPSRQAP